MKNHETSIFVKSLRLELGLSQKEFAQRFNSTRDKIAKYETGKVVPPGDLILKIQRYRFSKNN